MGDIVDVLRREADRPDHPLELRSLLERAAAEIESYRSRAQKAEGRTAATNSSGCED